MSWQVSLYIQKMKIILLQRKGGGNGTIKEETEMMQPHGKYCQHSPEAGRVKEHILRHSLWGSMVLTTLWFQLMIMISDFFLPDLWESNFLLWGLPRRHSGKESACQFRRHRRYQLDPWVKKIPWSRKRQPTPVYLPGKFHRQRSLAG